LAGSNRGQLQDDARAASTANDAESDVSELVEKSSCQAWRAALRPPSFLIPISNKSSPAGYDAFPSFPPTPAATGRMACVLLPYEGREVPVITGSNHHGIC